MADSPFSRPPSLNLIMPGVLRALRALLQRARSDSLCVTVLRQEADRRADADRSTRIA